MADLTSLLERIDQHLADVGHHPLTFRERTMLAFLVNGDPLVRVDRRADTEPPPAPLPPQVAPTPTEEPVAESVDPAEVLEPSASV